MTLTCPRTEGNNVKVAKLIIATALLLAIATPAYGWSHSQHRVRRTIALTLQAEHVSRLNRVAALKLAYRESGYRPTATNGSCVGVWQMKTSAPRSKWSNVAWETRKANRYVIHRYRTWRAALAHSYRYSWY